jgi:hypothetical protein
MPPGVLPANGEKIVQTFLRGHAAVSAIVGQRVRPEVDAIRPCVRVQQITESEDEDSRGWLTHPVLQFDAYAETQGQARILIDTVRMALREIGGVYAGGVVAGVSHERGPDWLPDEDIRTKDGYDMPRYSADYRIHLHPTP